MTVQDNTSLFKQSVERHSTDTPSSRIMKRKTFTKDKSREVSDSKEYINEGYRILNHLQALSYTLSKIREPYLDLESGRDILRNIHPTLQVNAAPEHWAETHRLSNEDRDQIDLQAKDLLSKCADRVKEMEVLEQRRLQSITRRSALSQILPSRLLGSTSDTSPDMLSVHRLSITWYLNRRLAEVGRRQTELQEERVNFQLERNNTLGSNAAQEAAGFHLNESVSHSSPKATRYDETSLYGDMSRSPRLFTPNPGSVYLADGLYSSVHVTYSNDLESEPNSELTPMQMQLFESENASLLRSVQTTLAGVQQAESRLLEISALQNDLMLHLTQQTELTNQLFEDAIASTEMVGKGNVQLKEAKRRMKDSRVYTLVFLLGASFGLLFLHYY